MDKVVVEEIREGKRKERKDKQAKIIAQLGTITNKVAIKIVEKCARAQFIIAWIPRKSVIDFTRTF